MKIVTVVGARPQFIKAAVLSRAFAALSFEIQEVLVHTGQHYDSNMSDIFFSELNIPRPDYSLCVGGGSHGQNTGRMLEKLEAVMIREKPNCVLVYGDTDSTLAGALAASKLHIPVAHVEAGLRSFNKRMPEEINRVLTDHVSALLFAPSEVARINLRNEGVPHDKIFVVGDVMYDAARYYKKYARKPNWFAALALDHKPESFVLCTIHRAENTDDVEKMKGILQGLKRSEMPIILPLHPRTLKRLESFDLHFPENVFVVDPVGYLEMVWLEVNCKFIATDSGGVQKEAYFHGKPCITLRTETEWTELVEAGVNTIVGADADKITNAMKAILWKTAGHEVYGDGASAIKIASILLEKF